MAVMTLAVSCTDKGYDTVEPADQERNHVLADTKVKLARFSEDLCSLVEKDLEAGKVITRSGELNNAVEELGIVSMERLFPYAGEFEERTRADGLHRWYKITLDDRTPDTRASGSLLNIKGVDILEDDRPITTNSFFNDPLLSQQWHYKDSRTPTASINVEPVWKSFTTGSDQVIVGVIDGGIDLSHEDLAANCIGGGTNGSRNFVDGSFNITADTHGTHVAGTIAAVNNNGKGVSGIAGGDSANGVKGVRLLSCQIFQTVGGKTYSGSTAQAIKWAADHGAVIINNSWGYTFDENQDGRLTGSELTKALKATISDSDKAAVDYFIRRAGYDAQGNQVGPMAGGVVIFAAGNDGIANGAPANYEPVIAVGATDANLKKSSFSNYGDWVDIAAPGSDILSTMPNGKYGTLDGTSMACPHVTGIAALLVSHYGGPGFTNEQLKEKLLGGANHNLLKGSQIGPFADAMGSFSYESQEAPDPVNDYSVEVSANLVKLKFGLTGDNKGNKAYSYLVVASQDKAKLENFKPSLSVPTGVVTEMVYTGNQNIGEEFIAKIQKLDFEKTYYVGILGCNYARRYSAMSPITKVVTKKNNAPMITIETDGEILVRAAETKEVVCKVSDPDEHNVTIGFEPGSNAANYSLSGDTFTMTIRGRRAEPGSYKAILTATDEYGAKCSKEIPYRILENEAPAVDKPFENIISYQTGQTFSVDLKEYFHDPDGEVLSYRVRGNSDNVTKVAFDGDIMTITTAGHGLSSMNIVAYDGGGKECSSPLKVLVKDSGDPAEMFPNPVTDNLTIRTEGDAETHIRITSQTGGCVFDKTMTFSGFDPAKIDMRDCAPGRYLVQVSYLGKTYEKNVIKR